ncbi:MAG: coproporphyrinogen dehydrogenase HemZ [Firmicutes bacterium]|nr:coproporphyrinogen dehydrogenase HemZ [Bacillota bacterium]
MIEEGGKNEQKLAMYEFLREKTGKSLDWGILTGVRPTKLYASLKESGREELLRTLYLVSDEKFALLKKINEVQSEYLPPKDPKAVGIYVGIPFCPTRCVYCAFTSNPITKPAAVSYLGALMKEIEAVRGIMSEKGLYAESVYIGGGTPSSLDDEDFERLLSGVRDAFISPKTLEFTVECGRPDTITPSKLKLVKKYGSDRISINPQSMKQRTLDLIGRSHTPEDIEEAFALAKEEGISGINADLIAGLPEEEPEDFRNSLETILALGPTNITVHTLAVKRSSRLHEQDSDYAYSKADIVREMLAISSEELENAGFLPYYLYRQKQTAGNFENVGYCKPGALSVYNVRIMEENQTILAMGAGAVSKIVFPDGGHIERIGNVSEYKLYIERIDEMIERKRENVK